MPHNRDSGPLDARQAPERQNNGKRRPNGVMNPHWRMIRLLQYEEERHDDVADDKNGKVWGDIVCPEFANFHIARTANRNRFQVALKDVRFPQFGHRFRKPEIIGLSGKPWPCRYSIAMLVSSILLRRNNKASGVTIRPAANFRENKFAAGFFSEICESQ